MNDKSLSKNNMNISLKDCRGWSEVPYENCSISKPFLRRKRWNHYLWMDKNFIALFAVADLDYAGAVYISFYNLKNGKNLNKSVVVPFAKDIKLEDKINGDVSYDENLIYIDVKGLENKLQVELKCDEILISSTIFLNKESLNVVVPWSKKHFHYTSKQMALKTEGTITLGKEEYLLNDALVFLDYGRGVWEYKKAWYWLTCGFIFNNEVVGVNIGAKWTDNTGINENAVSIGDKVYKINSDVEFVINNSMDTWRIKSKVGEEVNLTFTPIINSEEKHGAFVFKSTLKQYIGHVNGTIIIEGKIIELKDVMAWCEDQVARW